MSEEPGTGGRGREREALVETHLEERSLVLAGLYAEARRLLSVREPAGWTNLVGHVGRELMNRLADHEPVPIEDPDRKRGRTGTERYVERLREAAKSDDTAEMRAAAEWVVEDFERGRESIEGRAETLLGADAAEAGGDTAAWVSQWRRVQGVMVGFAHVAAPNAAPRDPEELAGAFAELTDLLAVRVAREPFFDSFDELMEIAHAAEPDADLARGALARLRAGTAARFFAELESPGWVELLAGLGVFTKEPPPPRRDGDWISFPAWPEGQVLLRFAGSAPESVAAAARSVPDSENASVAAVLAETALLLPAALVAGALARRVARDLGTSARLLNLSITAGDLIAHLAKGGCIPGALKILVALLAVDVRSEESAADFLPPRAVGRFASDSYQVTEAVESALPALLEADAPATFKKLVRQLRGAQRRLAFNDSTAWRDGIDGPDEPAEFEPRHLLLQLLRDAGIHVIGEGEAAGEAALAELEDEESAIFTRLRMYLLARSDLAAREGPELLGDHEVLFDFHSRPEVRELLGAAWPRLDVEKKVRLLESIDGGPDPTRIAIDPVAEAEKARSYRDDWRLALLEPLDGELDAEHQLWLEALRTARGPEIPLPRSGFFAAESPSTQEELAAMDPDALIIHLRDFRPDPHFGAPSREGLGREFGEAVAADPEHFLVLIDRLNELPLIYVRGALQGFAKALKGAWTPADGQVINAVAFPFSDAAEAAPADPERSGVQLVATDTLEALLRADPTIALREQIFAVIEKAAASPDPSPERDAQTEEPMGLAIGSIRGRAVEMALEYLGWLHRAGVVGFGEAPEAQGLLDRLAADPARAVRAMIGANLGRLAAVDIDWVAEHRPQVADPDGEEPARAGWEGYLGYGSIVSGDLAEALSASYSEAVDQLSDGGPEEERIRNSLAEHVGVIWRDVEERAPELLPSFLAHGTDEDKARLIGTLGRALRGSEPGSYQPDEAALERHRELWSARLGAEDLGTKEAEEFGWFFTSGRLTRSEDVERLARTLERTGGRVQDVRGALSLLARLVCEDPTLAESAMSVLEALAAAASAGPQYIRAAHLQSILREGLRGEDTSERARALIHAFGEQGFVALRALLD
jgi:hypothetical protein